MRFGIDSLLFTDTFLERDLPLWIGVARWGSTCSRSRRSIQIGFRRARLRQPARVAGGTVYTNFVLREALRDTVVRCSDGEYFSNPSLPFLRGGMKESA